MVISDNIMPQMLERHFCCHQGKPPHEPPLKLCRRPANTSVSKLMLGDRSQQCCLCTSLIRFVAVEEASQLLRGFNSRDGNGTDLFKPSQGAGCCTSSRRNDCRREKQNKRTQPQTLPAQKCSSLVVSPMPWPALFPRLPRLLGLSSFFIRMDLLSQLYLNSTCWSFPVNKKGTSVTQTVIIQGHLLQHLPLCVFWR